jgi:Na+-transporting NADH:ubiquinone oxidoreductase subunit C
VNINDNKYVFGFAIGVCLVCSILLSAVTETLRKPQEINAELEVKRNILKAVKLQKPVTAKTPKSEALQVYVDKITEEVIDLKGNVVEGKKPKDLTDKDTDLLALYVYKEGGKVIAYAYPIIGQGLWSTLYGYLAIDADGSTVRGITFYKHGETPGLGAEIEKDWFQNDFVGKTIFDVKDKKVTPIVVVKGKASDIYKGEELKYHVDGITAATLTGIGVTDLLAKWINIYEPYFSKVRAH